MNYRKIPFHEYNFLHAHVQYIYEITSETVDSYFAIPNGSIGLSVVINGSARICGNTGWNEVPNAMIFGMSRLVQKVEFGSNMREITIGFKPYILQQFITESMSQVSGGIVTDLNCIFNKYSIEQLVAAVIASRNDHQIVQAIETFLLNELKQTQRSKPLNAALSLIENEDYTSVQEISDKVGLSGTSIRSLFKDQVGLSPKEYIKVHRISRALNYKNSNELNMTGLAYELGYYDQAHFIHEFREVTGISPLQYFKNDGLTCDFYNFGRWRSHSFA